MATLIQSSTSDTLYFGWYGMCPDEVGGESECTPFILLEQESDSVPPAAGWRHKIFPEILTDPPAPTNGFTIGQSEFFRFIKEVNDVEGALTAYDGTSTSPFGLAGTQIKELVCGRCYYITLKPGDKQLEIPEFHFANQATSSYEYRITDSCASGPPGPTACTATATLKNNNSVAEIVIDLDEVTNDGTQDGKLSALEVVFDNIEFEQGATIANTKITADWEGRTDTEIGGFTNSTSVLMDHHIRDNGTLPTQKTTVFGMISFASESLRLIDYQSQTGSIWTFEVPVTSVLSGTEPIIAEVRIYDTSAQVLKYGVTEC